jgi:transcriptional regulator
MYNYPHYKEHDLEKLISFMRDHPFVTLIGSDKNGRIEVTQIPVLVEEKEGKLFIYGHIARNQIITRLSKKIQMRLLVYWSAYLCKRLLVQWQSSAGLYLELYFNTRKRPDQIFG